MGARTRVVIAGAVVALWVAASTGCAPITSRAYLQRDADLTRYHTYAWGPPDGFSTGDPRLDSNPFFAGRVRAQVERQLSARRFEKSDTSADLLVHMHIGLTQKIDVRDLDRDYEYCRDADCRPFIFDAGTLFIDLVDPRTNTLVWRGWAEASFDGVIDRQEWMERRIDEVVTRIMQRLPRL